MKRNLRARLGQAVFKVDGAMGSTIGAMGLPAADFRGLSGFNEILNLSRPDVIAGIHRAYYAAGADAVETNTFSANTLVMREQGLQDHVLEVNRAAAALASEVRDAEAAASGRQLFVLGSVGPGSLLPSLGQVDFQTMAASYVPQFEGLAEGGADAFCIETCQDILQVKAALHAARQVLERRGLDLPLIVSLTLAGGGNTLLGTDLAAAAAILEPLGVDVLGINCSAGPAELAPHVRELARVWPRHVMVMPNAGLPETEAGRLVYRLSPDDFAAYLREFVERLGVGIVGGCCGTSHEHIRAMCRAVGELALPSRSSDFVPSVASLFSACALRQEPAPFLVGERGNVNGSKEFREKLLQGDLDGMISVAKAQDKAGAHGLDLCLAYPGRKERADYAELVPELARRIRLPLMIDSTSPETVETALALHGGRCIVNSANLEAGEARLLAMAGTAKRHGAVCVALVIDEQGMALTRERKLEVAERLLQLCTTQAGLRPCDLVFDMLTFTVASGPESAGAARHTLEALEEWKHQHPDTCCVLGVSNVSYGLNPGARRVLNSVFLHLAVERGLDLAIVNAGKIMPLNRIPEKLLAVARELLLLQDGAGWKELMSSYLAEYESWCGKETKKEKTSADLPPEQALFAAVLEGDHDPVPGLVATLLEQGRLPMEIVNGILLPAMKEVGRLFGEGSMQLPFVLQSAEVMKKAVDLAEPAAATRGGSRKGRFLIGTVRGDVHDIGKNLVGILLSNNGFEVVDLGVRVPLDGLVAGLEQHKPLALGLSGLLVRSAEAMKEDLEELHRRGFSLPVIVGGAALNADYVGKVLRPAYQGPVHYAADAFDGLRILEALAGGRAPEDEKLELRDLPRKPAAKPVDAGLAETVAPFFGVRELTISGETLFDELDQKVLFAARWGFQRGNAELDEYEDLLSRKARPLLEELKSLLLRRHVCARAVYGYWRCRASGNKLELLEEVESEATAPEFEFTTPAVISGLGSSGHAVLPAFALTLGTDMDEVVSTLRGQERYRDMILAHGLGAALAETAAEHLHNLILREVQEAGGKAMRGRKGIRVSFGYPCCPDLANQAPLLSLLDARKIELGLSETFEMVPEYSVSALVILHPEAAY